ncbi:MAG: hypothetical protein ACKVP0_02085 [Pirellulaceae bacterium]
MGSTSIANSVGLAASAVDKAKHLLTLCRFQPPDAMRDGEVDAVLSSARSLALVGSRLNHRKGIPDEVRPTFEREKHQKSAINNSRTFLYDFRPLERHHTAVRRLSFHMRQHPLACMKMSSYFTYHSQFILSEKFSFLLTALSDHFY